jgi:Mg-chelatase subunit ChlD
MTVCALALVLLLDASASVRHDEWAQQVEAHAEAFEHPAVQAAIVAAGPIEVRVMVFSDHATPVTPWVPVATEADAYAFARELRGIQRGLAGGTNLGHAITAAAAAIAAGPRCERDVVDLVTDGEADAPSTAAARDAAAADGITINALAIGTEQAEAWLREQAATPDGFVLRAADWREAARALRRKLVREIAYVEGARP